ncbi:MAG: FtsH protease activity modulator HflK [Myxococcales bacterium]|nr:FtsH protease activity modulator HflK [Myxococcales bacterium]
MAGGRGVWRLLDRFIFAFRGHGRWVLAALVLAYAGLWFAEGFYTVDTQKAAVVQRFGALADARVPAGLHYRLPAPIESVTIVPTAEVQRLEIKTSGENTTTSQSAYVTGDENLIEIAVALQYRVRDPAEYVFSTDSHEAFIRAVAQTALTEIVATLPVDEVLTVGKPKIEHAVHATSQRMLDDYGLGIAVLSATVTAVEPPREVIFDFKAVSDAKAESRKLISEAYARRNDVVPKARGQAEGILRSAAAYRTERVTAAEGDAARFLDILTEYEKARSTTETRLYLETLEKILPKVKKYILSKNRDGTTPKVNLR